MKMIFLSTALAFLVSLNAFAGNISDIPEKDQVILSAPYSSWNPSQEQTKEALKQIQVFLEKPIGQNEGNKKEIKNILGNKRGYRVQCWGIEKEGKKLIVFNFFPAPDPKYGDHFTDWRKREILVADGGFDFWRIEYEPLTGKCTNFLVNGYA